jgi:ADP-ribose pyrophosphatase YjhB (NUDIX family)
MSLERIEITETAGEKRDRYLTESQLRRALREETGYVCRRSSPNHDDLYATTEFIIRGEFCGHALDIVFTVEDDRIVVITQMSQHSDSLRGRFYEYVGESVADAIECAE